ncbi:MAG TPA: GNAT family N-acetyltransferase [Solirubrobacteraceae bacterium]|nr:GNAT family N-acetyltransferase [Solirubrobacteraceae bacterium]
MGAAVRDFSDFDRRPVTGSCAPTITCLPIYGGPEAIDAGRRLRFRTYSPRMPFLAENRPLPTAVGKRFGVRWPLRDEAKVPLLGRRLARAHPVMPARLRIAGPDPLRWRPEVIAHGPWAPVPRASIAGIATSTTTVRSADPVRDAAACAAVYEPFVRDTVVSFEIVPPPAEDFAGRIERISHTHPWLVAEDAGRVVGFAYGSPHHERAAYRWAADVSVYVEPGSHRRGVGRALYGTLFALLQAQRMLIACAGITLPNEASVGIHESFGFVPVGVYRRIGHKFGAWHDVGWWQLELGPRRDVRHPPELAPPIRLESTSLPAPTPPPRQ